MSTQLFNTYVHNNSYTSIIYKRVYISFYTIECNISLTCTNEPVMHIHKIRVNTSFSPSGRRSVAESDLSYFPLTFSGSPCPHFRPLRVPRDHDGRGRRRGCRCHQAAKTNCYPHALKSSKGQGSIFGWRMRGAVVALIFHSWQRFPRPRLGPNQRRAALDWSQHARAVQVVACG